MEALTPSQYKTTISMKKIKVEKKKKKHPPGTPFHHNLQSKKKKFNENVCTNSIKKKKNPQSLLETELKLNQ